MMDSGVAADVYRVTSFRNSVRTGRNRGQAMGMLVDGEWVQDSFDTRTRKGAFVRTDSRFRNWVTPDGAPGPTAAGGSPGVRRKLMARA